MPQTVFAPSAGQPQADVWMPMAFQSSCVPRPSRNPGVISASMIT